MKSHRVLFEIKLSAIAAACLTISPFTYANVSGYTGPGVAIAHQDTTYGSSVVAKIFIADPEILVMPNGNYIVSHDLAGVDSGTNTALFLSTDKGVTWNSFGTLTNFRNGSFFLHDDALWIFGKTSGTLTMKKSTDNGTNWVTSITTKGGPFTPHNPAVWGGRLWGAGKTAAISAPVDSDLLLSDSWVKSNDISSTNHPEWRSEGDSIEESQILASPTYGVHLMARVNDHSYGALFHVATNGATINFDPGNDFVALPGGDKKFGATYDAESEKFIVISNPILPGDYRSDIAPNMIRNTAAVVTSRDMINWKVEKIFLHSDDVELDGFGYHNFDVDGENLVTVCRTAFPIPGTSNPHRSHDSNLITGHRIAGFRSLVPDQYLKCSGNQVLRYERTQYQDALLGSFALGTALNSPDSLGQDSAGGVYVHESGGRILYFDATGNFLHSTNTAPGALQASSLDINQPVDGSSTWVKSGGGDWFESTNWYYWGRADTAEEIATFGSALQASSTITVNESYTLKGVRFVTDKTCTISGSGEISLSTNGVVDVQQGNQIITLPLNLKGDLSVSAETGTSVTVNSIYNSNGNSLNKTGYGTLTVANGSFCLNGGTLTVGGGAVLFTNSICKFNGTVRIMTAAGFVPTVGHSCRIVKGEITKGMFDEIILPELEAGLGWDASELYSNGMVTVILKVPENWMTQYGLPTDGSADLIDSDGDGMNNYSEWKAGTSPTNAFSYFKVTQNPSAGTNGFRLQWNSLTNRTYRIESSTNLTGNPAFQIFRSGIQGGSSFAEFIDTNSINRPRCFYRIVIE